MGPAIDSLARDVARFLHCRTTHRRDCAAMIENGQLLQRRLLAEASACIFADWLGTLATAPFRRRCGSGPVVLRRRSVARRARAFERKMRRSIAAVEASRPQRGHRLAIWKIPRAVEYVALATDDYLLSTDVQSTPTRLRELISHHSITLSSLPCEAIRGSATDRQTFRISWPAGAALPSLRAQHLRTETLCAVCTRRRA